MHTFVYVIELTSVNMGTGDVEETYMPVLRQRGVQAPLRYSAERFGSFHAAYIWGCAEFEQDLPPIWKREFTPGLA